MAKTYLFYDIETTGLNKCFDQVIQFAAIRTDSNLNEIERYEYFLKLNNDVVPSPRAFITHRIPLSKLEEGMNELDGMIKIHALLNTPDTVSIGYNSLGFDDEFLRFSFYRNFLPPYTHQYAQGCSRMDLYPMALICSLFKKNLLRWPENNLKLENIGNLNGFSEGVAHNAMVDVITTLKLARCLHQEQETWNYLRGFFDKQTDLQRCQDLAKDSDNFAILIDGKFGFEQQYQCAVTCLGTHQHYKNQMLWLRLDHTKLGSANPDNILEHTWVVNKKLGEPALILPMKNRFLQKYLQSKQDDIQENLIWLKSNPALLDKISHHYRHYTYPKINNLDVAAGLYDNGFLSPHDQEICRKIHSSPAANKIKCARSFSESYLIQLAIRALGHHYFDSLSQDEQITYKNYLNSIFSGKNNSVDYRGNPRLSPQSALDEINELAATSLDAEQQSILVELAAYIQKARQ